MEEEKRTLIETFLPVEEISREAKEEKKIQKLEVKKAFALQAISYKNTRIKRW